MQAVKYDFVVENEDVFTPCEDFPDKYIDKFFDISGLSFEREADLIKVTGDVKLIHEFEKAIPIQVNFKLQFISFVFLMCPAMGSDSLMRKYIRGHAESGSILSTIFADRTFARRCTVKTNCGLYSLK